ncbi:MAG: SprT family zinc-dependent metalloprotease [Candidatus Fermentibacteraceae bacterium]
MELVLPAPIGTIHVEVVFEPRKRITIRIRPDGRVRVTAPLSAEKGFVQKVLLEKSRWIARHLERLAVAPPIPTIYKPGAMHYFLGSPFTLVAVRANRPGVALEDGRLLVSSPAPEDPEALETALRRWYRKQAEPIIGERLSVWSPRLPLLPDHEVRFRWMRSRWGSCSRSNALVFNTQLVKAPLSCIDYVVVHELCHTIHHDHGPGFKHLLDTVMPDWKATADRLKNLPVLL